ncbi:hypothetical protein HN031_01790 [Nocardioides sp. zg-1308]|uniref:ribosomal protein L7/L12 n=1 Tax=Nocardioides TaxID=1839 RepID=UPI00155410A1|nr:MULTISPECIES: ribosomal protein L7/L12 [unclassified Nocardioides]NPD03413.1 hypothetical protein [Nocardioides sp. zg-1308]WQQ21311.1 ribosomal protein L7/L12 [Nocardioides sp. S-34]
MGLFSKPEVISPGSGNDADRARIAELERRVARLEAQLAQLAAAGSAGTPAAVPAEPWMAEVQALRRAGKTIHAIKLYRDHTGVGLKEAKDAVDAMPG